jgi:NAD(P)-dependent dehydrogenase (short-subunit alcohol dehydrogenase family)
MRMPDEWIIVTGASSGIGRAVSLRLARDGFGVCLVGRDLDRLSDVARQIGEAQCRTVECDLSDVPSIAGLCDGICREVGPIRGLVHAAGTMGVWPMSMNTYARALRVFNVHFFAALEFIRCLSAPRRHVPGASIVLVSSVAAHSGDAGNAVYAAAKGALEGLLLAATAELTPKAIRLNAVVLGLVNTPWISGAMMRMDPDQKKRFLASFPLGAGTPEDAAELIAFLVGNKARWITGSVMWADGGFRSRQVT